MKYHEIFLPMPTSINASKTVSRGFRNPKTGKWQRIAARSKEYTEWIEDAGRAWRDQYPKGVKEAFRGRISVVYVFVWPLSNTSPLSDIGNREKVLSDFLQGKFYENDNQIDEQRQFRRLWGAKKPYAWVRVYEIADGRAQDPAKLFTACTP